MNLSDLQDLLIQMLNVTLMFSVGLEVNTTALRSSLKRWKLLSTVLTFNFGLLPLMVWVLVTAFALPDAVAIGLMLAAFCPGGGTGTLFTRTAKGSMELSVILLGLLTLFAVLLTPLLIKSSLTDGSQPLPLLPLLKTLVLFQLLPLVIGGLIRIWSVTKANLLDRLARPLSNGLFAILVLGLLITQGHLVPSVGWRGIATMTLAVAASVGLPHFFKVSWKDRAALSLTTGVRNLALALLLSSTFFTNQTTITLLAYGLVMYVLSAGWVVYVRRFTTSPTENET